MSANIPENIKSVSDLKKKTREIFKQMHYTGSPIIITVNGKPNAVLLDAEVFERKLKALDIAVLLSEAEDDVNKGHIRQARNFLKELKNVAKVPC
jgi:prevent-host-death family protein